jgi:hypothetical protein
MPPINIRCSCPVMTGGHVFHRVGCPMLAGPQVIPVRVTPYAHETTARPEPPAELTDDLTWL